MISMGYSMALTPAHLLNLDNVICPFQILSYIQTPYLINVPNDNRRIILPNEETFQEMIPEQDKFDLMHCTYCRDQSF